MEYRDRGGAQAKSRSNLFIEPFNETSLSALHKATNDIKQWLKLCTCGVSLFSLCGANFSLNLFHVSDFSGLHASSICSARRAWGTPSIRASYIKQGEKNQYASFLPGRTGARSSITALVTQGAFAGRPTRTPGLIVVKAK